MNSHHPKRYNRAHALISNFGTLDDYDFSDFPIKISGVRLARIEVCKYRKSAAHSFPHKYGAPNPKTQERNWKSYRATQYKV